MNNHNRIVETQPAIRDHQLLRVRVGKLFVLRITDHVTRSVDQRLLDLFFVIDVLRVVKDVQSRDASNLIQLGEVDSKYSENKNN